MTGPKAAGEQLEGVAELLIKQTPAFARQEAEDKVTRQGRQQHEKDCQQRSRDDEACQRTHEGSRQHQYKEIGLAQPESCVFERLPVEEPDLPLSGESVDELDSRTREPGQRGVGLVLDGPPPVQRHRGLPRGKQRTAKEQKRGEDKGNSKGQQCHVRLTVSEPRPGERRTRWGRHGCPDPRSGQ